MMFLYFVTLTLVCFVALAAFVPVCLNNSMSCMRIILLIRIVEHFFFFFFKYIHQCPVQAIAHKTKLHLT